MYDALNLHGRQHNKSEYNLKNAMKDYLRYDVAVDANGYAPVAEDKIREFFEDNNIFFLIITRFLS